jgi:(+)-trans-carveol dehydrogenase
VGTPMLLNDTIYQFFAPDKPNATKEDLEAALSMMMPSGKPYMQPEEITEGLLFLASPEARNISGIQYDVSAGSNAFQAG